MEGARQNNLKNISLGIPHNKVTAVTGLSGSGKSSLAFDTLFAEGQWRYVESLSTYARMFLEKVARPDVDRVLNVRPAIAIEQKNQVRTARSTVGTTTEIADFFGCSLPRSADQCALTVIKKPDRFILTPSPMIYSSDSRRSGHGAVSHCHLRPAKTKPR